MPGYFFFSGYSMLGYLFGATWCRIFSSGYLAQDIGTGYLAQDI
tara:strand:- start:57 stop:188 length:132 start_codon:yes stop_codon:yes gene_type:complete